MKPRGTSLIFFNDREQVLLFLRDDKPGIPCPNMWDLPGGHVEAGETPRECILREMREEIGRDIEGIEPFSVVEFEDRTEYVFWKRMNLDVDGIRLTEGQRLRWFSRDEVEGTPLAFGFNAILASFYRDVSEYTDISASVEEKLRRNMPMTTVQERLIGHLKPQAAAATVADVRIGLGYTAVRLDTGHAGVAWTPKEMTGGCTHLRSAGTLSGRCAAEILDMLADTQSALSRAVGLAVANALLAAAPVPAVSREEVISSLGITAADRVAMVGYFAPVVARLKGSGCRLDVVELNPFHAEGTLTPEQGEGALSTCTVAVITGTSLINGTFDTVCGQLGNPRAAVLLGPSSPLCAGAFHGTPITHVAGSRVKDPEAILRIVSEGGGTMVMKRYLAFETVMVRE